MDLEQGLKQGLEQELEEELGRGLWHSTLKVLQRFSSQGGSPRRIPPWLPQGSRRSPPWKVLVWVSIAAFLAPACGSGEAQDVLDPTFLWQVDSDQNRVYLLGSIHFLKPEDYPLPPAMQTAFNEAEGVVFELDLALAENFSTQTLFLQRAQPEQGESLQASLSPQTYDLAQAAAKEVGVPIEIFHPFEPWLFTLSFLPLKLQHLGFQADYGVDRHFFDQAQDQAKEIIALETIDYQIGLFDDLPAETQEEFLLQTLLEIETLETSLNAMIETWKQGDVAAFEALAFESFEQFPELEERLLTTRNRNWIAPIEALLQKQDDYLIIVGAAHLVGEAGVVQLLQDQGYTVEQVTQ
jgi:uncharacterized protein YbaP (TraB family)